MTKIPKKANPVKVKIGFKTPSLIGKSLGLIMFAKANQKAKLVVLDGARKAYLIKTYGLNPKQIIVLNP